jgi:hypothetical protein
VVKKLQQHFFNLRRLKKCGLSPKTLTNIYRSTIESGCIITLPALHNTYSTRCHRKAKKIIKDNNNPVKDNTTCSHRYHTEGEVSTAASKLGPRD